MSLILNLMMTMTSSPIAMSALLICQSLMVIMSASLFQPDNLVLIILALVFVGGILVVFTYLCSVSYNELVSWDYNMSFWLLCPSFILLCTSALPLSSQGSPHNPTLMLFSNAYVLMLVYLIMLLLLVMIMVTCVSSTTSGKVLKK